MPRTSIAGVWNEVQRLQQSQLSGVRPTIFNFVEGTVTIRQIGYKTEENNQGDSWIWGTSNAIWGTGRWGNRASGWTQIASETLNNQLTNVGRNQLRDFLCSQSYGTPDYFAIGSGTTAYVASQTALDEEISGSTRLATDFVTSGNISTLKTEFGIFDNNYTITEFGIFDATSGGNMFIRTPITSFTKTETSKWRIFTEIQSTNDVPFMDEGSTAIRNWVAGTNTQNPIYVAWGSGSDTISTTATAIPTEISRTDVTSYDNTLDYTARIEGVMPGASGSGFTVNRVGLFDAVSGSPDQMYIYDEIPQISKTTNIEINTMTVITIN